MNLVVNLITEPLFWTLIAIMLAGVLCLQADKKDNT